MMKKTIIYAIIKICMSEILKNELEYIEKIKKIVGNEKKATVITFGCQMNAKDSEKYEGILEKCGFKLCNDEENADFVLFNTCTIRENANKRLYGRIGQLKNSYYKNKNKIIGICGCMMQEEDEVSYIKNKYPYVKLIFGTHNIYNFPKLLYDVLKEQKRNIEIVPDNNIIVENLPSHRKYFFKCGINIMFGCNNFCSYCIVPYVRGREKSRNSEDIINEIKSLVKDRVVEVMLLGQNVNSYGNDNSNYSFPELLENVSKIEGLKRIRFMTSHPKDFSDELIEVIKNNKNICRHIHLPLQSGSNKILKLMNRKYTREHYLNIINKIKNNIKDVSITTDIIVGFPNEDEDDFNDTLSIIREVGFDSVFTFEYSKRTGTVASKMENQVDEKIVKIRFKKLLDTINEMNKNKFDKFIGNTYEVLVEEKDRENNLYLSRLSNNIICYIEGNDDMIGKFYDVKILNNHGFYLDGEVVKDDK